MLDHARTAALTLLLAACSGGGAAPADKPGPKDPEPEVQENIDVEIPMVAYKWDPQAGDPSVPAELGGPGFTGEGWTTNMMVHAIGNPDAPKGGEIVLGGILPDWPATLRMAGKNWNTQFNYFVSPLINTSLLSMDPVTLEQVPNLATHWQISEDKTTYRFRLNPDAKWSDGKPMTAEDVVATWKLKTDATLLDPSSVFTYGKLHEPKAVSKYIVEVKAKEESWRNFLYFSGMSIMPAHEIGSITGTEYLDKYQFSYPATSGPYEVRPENIDQGNSITITRRDDWWGQDNPVNAGLFNFDSIKAVVVKDPQLAFEKIKKGETDYFYVSKAQWWAEDIPDIEAVKRGLLVPRKFYNEEPIGTSGLALNSQRKPLDDVRIRKALQHLYDRETMIEKLFYNEYEPLTSYYQGGTYQNPDNEHFAYDEIAAVELLEEAGWSEINGDGYRIKDGRELSFKLTYSSSLSERMLTVFQESAKRAGIRVELQLLTPAAGWKNVQEKAYEIHAQAWGALIFPNPESSWHSRLSAEKNNNNITAFANPRVDELCAEYDTEYDIKRRIEIIREIDGILYNEHPYVLGWFGPAHRVLFWNKFGMPEWGGTRYGDYLDMLALWWVEPEKEKQLAAARQDPNATMEPGTNAIRFWSQFAAKFGGAVKGDAAAGGEETP